MNDLKANWGTIIPVVLALLIYGGLVALDRDTEAFIAGAITIIGAAQAQRAVRKMNARETDTVRPPPPEEPVTVRIPKTYNNTDAYQVDIEDDPKP